MPAESDVQNREPPDDILVPAAIPPSVHKPRLIGDVVFRDAADDVIDAMLAEVLIHAHNCVRAFGDFHLAVSGVAASEVPLRRLMCDPALREFPWVKTRIWVVNDVTAPVEEAGSRSRRVADFLVEHSGIPHNQFHPIGSGPSENEVAEAYSRQLREILGWRPKGHDRLDCVLLFLDRHGDIGIMPHDAVTRDLLVAGRDASGTNAVAMTDEFINAARFIAVLSVGGDCREPIATLDLKRPAHERTRPIPAARLKPLAGELRWYIDRAACMK